MQPELLLLEDIDNLGRKGDLVKAKPGFVRNFLLPEQKAVIADKRTLRMRERLQTERAEQAKLDKSEAEAIADKIGGKTFTMEVKVDHDGHMYGSVTAKDVAEMLKEEGVLLEKKWIGIHQPLKTLGVHSVVLKLKEEVRSNITLSILPEGGELPQAPKQEEAAPEEEAPSEEE